MIKELLAGGQKKTVVGRQEGGWNCGVLVILVQDLLAGGREQQAVGRQEEDRSLDLVVVLVVELHVISFEISAS